MMKEEICNVIALECAKAFSMPNVTARIDKSDENVKACARDMAHSYCIAYAAAEEVFDSEQ